MSDRPPPLPGPANRPPPLPGPTQARRSGCFIAVAVVLGLLVLVLVAGGIGAWLFLRSETGQRVRQTVSAGISLTRDAARAPGTEALRAAGCTEAMVVPTGRVFELLGEFAPEANRGNGPDADALREPIVVFCQLDVVDDRAPDCGEVARVYTGALQDPPERFGVMVLGEGRRGRVCEGAYARDGSRLDLPD